LVNNVVEIMFEQLGASLQAIGLTSLFHLPWNLKFLWGPFVDQYETKRRWLLWTEVFISALILFLAFVVGTAGQLSAAVSVGFLLLAFFSATHDIAIDGFYLEGLDETEQSAYVGWRATFYKIASVMLGGPLLWLIGRSGWLVGLLVVGAMMVVLTVYHAFLLPNPEARQRPIRELLASLARPRILAVASALAVIVLAERHLNVIRPRASSFVEWVGGLPVVGDFTLSTWVIFTMLFVLLVGGATSAATRSRRVARRAGKEQSAYVAAFSTFIDQRRALVILAFVVLYRTGESFLMKMRWPFLHKVVEMSLEDYAIFNGTVGVIASFTATLAGGWLISKIGLRRCIWPFVLAQNLLNLLYMGVAGLTDPSTLTTPVLAGVIALEHAGAGLGTAIFMVFLMRCCDPRHKAAHMAILTALMSVSFTIAGVASGFLAERIGFFAYFGLTFLATFPSMLLIPFLPHLDGRERDVDDDGGADGVS
jgi:PAT family beta-lactamase induction signal transducer AmpG